MGTFGKIVIGFVALTVGSAVAQRALGTQEKAKRLLDNIEKLNK